MFKQSIYMTDLRIHTPDTGLRAAYDHCDVNGFPVPFYYAAPAGKSNLPVVLVVQEIFGLHAYIADVCRRFAQQGYLAIAADLYKRQGNATDFDDIPQLMSGLVNRVPQDQVLADLDATLAWAGANGGDLGRAAITGFCWGGRISWLYCAHNPTVRTGVAWYGRLMGAKTALQPEHPLDITERLRVPVLALYGGKDAGIPLSMVDEMKNALATAATAGNPAAAQSTFVIYPEAEHAFHADYRPAYRASDAADGFQRTLDWFAAHGVA